MAGDKTAKVKLKVEVDTKQAVRETDKLAKKQKESKQSTVSLSQKMQKSMEAEILLYGKVAVAVAAVVGAFSKLKHAAQTYADVQLQIFAADGIDTTSIERNAGNLITEYQALGFAAATTNSDFQLSQSQMEMAARAMRSLVRQGNDLQEVYTGVTKALVQGNVRALRPFGISLTGTSGTMKAFTTAMSQLNKEAAKLGDLSSVAGEKVIQAGVKWSDAMHRIEVAIGKLAAKLAPVVERLASMVDLAAAVIEMDWKRAGMASLGIYAPKARQRAEAKIAAEKERNKGAIRDVTLEPFLSKFMMTSRLAKEIIDDFLKELKRRSDLRREMAALEEGRRSGYREQLRTGREEYIGPDNLPIPIPGLEKYAGPGLGTVPGLSGRFDAMALDREVDEAGRMGKVLSEAARMQEAIKDIVTPMELLEQTGAMALAGLGNAAGEAFGAFITGSESAGEAFKKFAGQVLLSSAKQMMGTAVTEGVLALVDLARGWATGEPAAFRASAGHAAAAAAASAAALALGAMAGAMGVGDTAVPNANPPSVAGGAGALSSGGGVPGGRHVNVFVGSDFEDNARANASRLARAFGRASQMYGGGEAVVVHN